MQSLDSFFSISFCSKQDFCGIFVSRVSHGSGQTDSISNSDSLSRELGIGDCQDIATDFDESENLPIPSGLHGYLKLGTTAKKAAI